jgi:hypothetical protein
MIAKQYIAQGTHWEENRNEMDGHDTTAPAAEQPREIPDSSPVDMEIFLEIAGNKKRTPEMARRYSA